VVKIFDISDGENSHVVRGIVDDVVAKLSGHRQAIEDQCLDIPQDVSAVQDLKDASQGARIESRAYQYSLDKLQCAPTYWWTYSSSVKFSSS
jgi:hypothetical protein